MSLDRPLQGNTAAGAAISAAPAAPAAFLALLALALSGLSLLALAFVGTERAFAEGLNDGPKSEVVYARLSDSGSVKDVFVVNVLRPDKPGTVVDYGSYEQVRNLTDTSELALSAEGVTASVGTEPFTYQGNARERRLPWDISITYKLDGQEIGASALAGRSGKLEITITTTKDPLVDESFFENYLLQATLSFSGESTRSVTAPDGQIALAGSTTQVTFTGLPGREGAFVARAEVRDFEMDGISFAAVPFSMAIDLPDTKGLTSSFGDLEQGIEDLAAGASALAQGAQSLSGGAAEINQGVFGLRSGAAELAAAAAALAESSMLIEDSLDGLAQGGAELAEGSSQVNEGLQGLSQAAEAGQGLFSDPRFMAFLNENPDLMAAAAVASGVTGGVQELAAQYGGYDAGMQEYSAGVQELAVKYGFFNEGMAGISWGSSQLSNGMSQVLGGTGELSAGADDLAGGMQELSRGVGVLALETQGMPEKVQAEIDKMIAEYNKDDFTVVSFASPRNTNIDLVQFVVSSEPIKLPAAEEKPELVTELSFWDRLMALF
ncbi:MAG: hypothetical protein FWG23_02790 [Eggerthellaceae bacterium]|nr:hypothetical protein [Eggerthellaceae bacterium]MDR2715912.1 hypothetical protein [Coriobacteriaceae bacterium]